MPGISSGPNAHIANTGVLYLYIVIAGVSADKTVTVSTAVDKAAAANNTEARTASPECDEQASDNDTAVSPSYSKQSDPASAASGKFAAV